MRRTSLAAVTAALLALPGTAAADVFVQVPAPFLGGPIWNPLAATSPEATGRPSLAPRADADPCQGSAPGDCVVLGRDAEVELAPLPAPGPAGPGDVGDGVGIEAEPTPDADTPGAEEQERRPLPATPPTPAEMPLVYGDLVFPAPAFWLPWQRPTLRWRAQQGATYYNVQIFRGTRRVLNAWSEDTRLRVPEGVLRQGRSYVWVVWPARGPRREARYAAALGRSTFAVTLRPRIVFRRTAGGLASGEIRPHIPFATLSLNRPASLAKRVAPSITLDARSRFVIPISTRAAERLGARLIARGPNPPVGLRGPGL